jgi:hypothetical protein
MSVCVSHVISRAAVIVSVCVSHVISRCCDRVRLRFTRHFTRCCDRVRLRFTRHFTRCCETRAAVIVSVCVSHVISRGVKCIVFHSEYAENRLFCVTPCETSRVVIECVACRGRAWPTPSLLHGPTHNNLNGWQMIKKIPRGLLRRLETLRKCPNLQKSCFLNARY